MLSADAAAAPGGTLSAPWKALCATAAHIAVETGDIHAGRRAVLAVTLGFKGAVRKTARHDCGKIWVKAVDRVLGSTAVTARGGVKAFMQRVHATHLAHEVRGSTPVIPQQCWHQDQHSMATTSSHVSDRRVGLGGGDEAQDNTKRTQDAKDAWFRCCTNHVASMTTVPAPAEAEGEEEDACFQSPAEALACCTFGPGSDSYLSIPALHSVSVSVQLPGVSPPLVIDQAGFLRLFDVPTVLWPAGYLLTQWLSSSDQCSSLKNARVLELGTGVGTSSITAALCGAATVVATDNSPRSLALAQANAALNGAQSVVTRHLDWQHDQDIARFAAQGQCT